MGAAKEDRALLGRVHEVLGRAMAIARAATPQDFTDKGPQDFVTSVDLEIDRFLQAELGALVAKCPVLSEERAVDRHRLKRYWIVDPIDGTLNLMAGLPFYGISIALIDKRGPRLAAVGAVVQNSVWSALRGQGAWRDGRRLRLTAASPPPVIVLSTGLLDRLAGDPARFAALRKIGKVRNLGAQSLHLCGVAAGQFAAVASIEARVWDEAAGGLILREAGGHWSARSDAADWRDPAALMALPEQRSLAAHPEAAAAMAAILAPVFDAEGPAGAPAVADLTASPDPTDLADPAAKAAVASRLTLDRKTRGIALRDSADGRTTAFCVLEDAAQGPPAAPDWRRTAFVCPPAVTPDTALLIGLRQADGTARWARVTPAALEDATPPALAVSRFAYDLAQGRVLVAGWEPGLGRAGRRVVLHADGQEVQEMPASARPDVAARNSFIAPDCGFSGTFALTAEHVARLRAGRLRLDLRTMQDGQTLQTVALDDVDPAGQADALALYDRRARIAAKAAALPRWRLEWLIASEPFRRRWQGSQDSLAWMVRTAVVEALIARLQPGDEIAVRLYNGDRVLCQPVDDPILARKFLITGGDERGFLDWLETRIAPGDRVLDIGAAYGMISRALARRGAQVTALEADPISCDRIRRSGLAFGDGRIELIEMAVSDRPGEVVFAGMGKGCAGVGKILETGDDADLSGFLDGISDLNLMPLAARPDPGSKEHRSFGAADVDLIRVPATTIDTICTERGLSGLALMKIDIEGGELMALHGASGLLEGAFGPPPVVVFEYSTLFAMRGGDHPEVLDLFFRRGWRLFVQAGGKSAGGALVEITRPAEAPAHDNIIAFPPGRATGVDPGGTDSGGTGSGAGPETAAPRPTAS